MNVGKRAYFSIVIDLHTRNLLTTKFISVIRNPTAPRASKSLFFSCTIAIQISSEHDGMVDRRILCAIEQGGFPLADLAEEVRDGWIAAEFEQVAVFELGEAVFAVVEPGPKAWAR